MPPANTLTWIRKLDKQTPVLIYCYHGNSSKEYGRLPTLSNLSRS